MGGCEIIFLGTGGGRFATFMQPRATGGVYVKTAESSLHIDPGPGAVVQMHRLGLDPRKTTVIAISHCHPDHYCDAEVLMEAMTEGTRYRRGALFGSVSVVSGLEKGKIGPAISQYHRSIVESVRGLRPGESAEYSGIKLTATPAAHSDPGSIGFVVDLPDGRLGYTSDTAFAPDIAAAYAGCRLLIMAVTRPLGGRIPWHLCTEDAAQFAAITRPELAVITHFGLRVLEAPPETQAAWIEKETGVRTIPAEDFMCIAVAKTIAIQRRS